MLVRVGGSNDVAAGAMRVFDVAGTKVNVASVSGNTAGIVSVARVSKRGRASGSTSSLGRPRAEVRPTSGWSR
jgi:hypothetical protein